MQSTAPHWTVILEEVTSDTLTDVGAVDGADKNVQSKSDTCLPILVNSKETFVYLIPE